MSCCCHGLPKACTRQSFDVIFTERDDAVLCHKVPRQLVVTVFALVGNPFVEPGREVFVAAPLCLAYALDAGLELFWVIDLLAGGGGYQVMVTGIDADDALASSNNRSRFAIDKETEIPTGSTFNDPSTFDFPFGEILLVISNHSEPGNFDFIDSRPLEPTSKDGDCV